MDVLILVLWVNPLVSASWLRQNRLEKRGWNNIYDDIRHIFCYSKLLVLYCLGNRVSCDLDMICMAYTKMNFCDYSPDYFKAFLKIIYSRCQKWKYQYRWHRICTINNIYYYDMYWIKPTLIMKEGRYIW